MSKTYKVHEDFDLEHLSWDEENCHCDAPSNKQNDFNLVLYLKEKRIILDRLIFMIFLIDR